MCGICAVLFLDLGKQNTTEKSIAVREESFCRLKCRGPDDFGSESLQVVSSVHLSLHASLLHMRGATALHQPYKDECGNVLLWNGEIFGGSLYSEENVADTVVLGNALLKCATSQDVLSVFEAIQGPWAFIYFQNKTKLLWFGRDVFGRRSLLWSFFGSTLGVSLKLSSIQLDHVSMPDEVPCNGIYSLDVCATEREKYFIMNLYSWTRKPSGPYYEVSETNICDNILIKVNVSKLKLNIPIKTPLNREIPTSINKPDLTLTGMTLFESLIRSSTFHPIIEELESVLSSAVKCRIESQTLLCHSCLKPRNLCLHSSVCVLFSGGLDSMVIAALADRYVPENTPIDLVNVAFASKRKKKMKNSFQQKNSSDRIDTPDRITGWQGVAELENLGSRRKWNFVEVNVSQEELETERMNIIHHLVSPSFTVLDDSIGCALWFAARGKGMSSLYNELYCSPARVVLVGMGADELFAGYARHRGKFASGNWNALLDELSLELDRISSRNLGRDDRVISHHGREARFPFLDENVVSFVNKIPIWLKANLHYPRGIGEKLLLRLLAYKLGLKGAAILSKRAIQFGSRIARCENAKEKGTDLCNRLASVDVT